MNVSFVEIYNENIRDLINTESDYLELRDDPNKGLVIAGVEILKVENIAEVRINLKIFFFKENKIP